MREISAELSVLYDGSDPAWNGLPNFVRSLNPAVQALERMAAVIAPTDIPVLLVGENGAGKKIFARLIHQLSSRGKESLLKLSCASLGVNSLAGRLQEAESKAGRNGGSRPGSLLFEEVGELNAESQGELLRALADGDATRGQHDLGARRIFTTARDLEQEMQAGRFRNDLYYRINCVCLRLPPLRQRKEDVPTLVDFFLTRYSAHFSRPRPTISSQVLQRMLDYSWPGNIRQLETVVEKIAALGEDQAIMADLNDPPSQTSLESRAASRLSLKSAARAASRHAERQLILTTLARTRWNRKRAAQELQISYKSLLYKLKHIGQDNSDANKQGL